MELLFMDPVFKEAIWGGTKLRDVFDYEIPSDTTGECWAISGHANGMSHVAGGRFDGIGEYAIMNLDDFYRIIRILKENNLDKSLIRTDT